MYKIYTHGNNFSKDEHFWCDLQLEETVHILRKRIEPEAPTTPEPPSAPLYDPTPMEEDGVSLASPMLAVPPPPLLETQNEGEQAEKQLQQEQQLQEERHEERQEEQQQPPPPSGSEELLTPAELPQDSATGKLVFYGWVGVCQAYVLKFTGTILQNVNVFKGK